MSVAKKVALGAVIYIGYQLLTNKKYEGLRKDILNEYQKAKPSIIETLDDIHNYLVVPKDVSDETVRIKIDKEIETIKQKLKKLDAAKVAERTNKIIVAAADTISKTINIQKKRK